MVEKIKDKRYFCGNWLILFEANTVKQKGLSEKYGCRNEID